MKNEQLIPNLFRTEYRKIISVLCSLFGIQHIEIAEDIASDTFLSAVELWSTNGSPENPTAWLYTVAKNKAKNHLKHHSFLKSKANQELMRLSESSDEIELDLSVKNIEDSQLAMIFAVCHPSISSDAQISLALNLLCGFSVHEIADAFLTNREVIYKRISRAKETLKVEGVEIIQPIVNEMDERLATVLKTLYLLFSEGYYSTSQDVVVRKELCEEAIRLNTLLCENEITSKPPANALLALMFFHSSRFGARINDEGEPILYEHQNTELWNNLLIEKGESYLNKAAVGSVVSKYHFEAAIAYWHTQRNETIEKWENILRLYNQLLILEYSPIAALNRTYVLSKVYGKEEALKEAHKLKLDENHLYFALLGNLYTDIDNSKALMYMEKALHVAKTTKDKATINKSISALKQ